MRGMLSVSSLAAFSSSNGIGAVHPTPVRAPGSPPPNRPPPVQGASGGTGDGAVTPTRTLPRGSLLDLSV